MRQELPSERHVEPMLLMAEDNLLAVLVRAFVVTTNQETPRFII